MSSWLDDELETMVAPRRDSKQWKRQVTTWRAFLAQLGNPADHKECGNYVLGTFKGDRRLKSAITSRGGGAGDADYAGDIDEFEAAVSRVLRGHPFALYSTWRSTPGEPRLRLLVPFSRPVSPDEYHHIMESIMTQVGRDRFDPGSSEPERYMFLPSAQVKRNYYHVVRHADSTPIDVDEWLIDFADDLSGESAPRSKTRHKANPYEIDGVIGAFNRAYPIPDAIERFELPYEVSADARWHLVGARAISGMAEVSEGIVFSHHATDPAFGVACNAFDLVRLHRFGDLDDDDSIKPNTPLNRLPSQKAMLEFASRDERVVRELVGLDFAEELDAFADEETADADAARNRNWVDQLRIVAATGAVEDCIANWRLIVAHDPILSRIAYNELTQSVEFTNPPPWVGDAGAATFDPVVGKRDLVEIRGHIEERYRVKLFLSNIDELVILAGNTRAFHPVRDYLDSLPAWDGTPRVETFLPATPTEYTRMVTRKALAASVARVYNPGVKWDHVVMLRGGEGTGKSTCLEYLYRGLTAPLGRVGSKDTLLTCHRSWAVVADEAHALTRADKEVLKEFITLREDVYRMPYDRAPRAVRRAFTIWSTTNTQKVLVAAEGNRRYLPVECDLELDWGLITDPAYIDQVWAEAKLMYQKGEVLYVEPVENQVAAEVREGFTSEEPTVGLIESYIDTLVPETWDTMPSEERQQWMADRASGLVPEGTRSIDELCSIQVWCEVLQRRRGEHKRGDLVDITNALRKLSGWEELPGRHRQPEYGPQLTFRRIPETTTTDLEDIL